MLHETITGRVKKLLEKEGFGDWRCDYKKITGVDYEVRSWIARIHPDDTARVVAAFVRCHRTGRAHCQYRLLTKDGEYKCVSVGAIRIADEWIGAINIIPKTDIPRNVLAKALPLVSNILAFFACNVG